MYCSRYCESPIATMNGRPWRFWLNHDGLGNDPTIAVGRTLSLVATNIACSPLQREISRGRALACRTLFRSRFRNCKPELQLLFQVAVLSPPDPTPQDPVAPVGRPGQERR